MLFVVNRYATLLACAVNAFGLAKCHFVHSVGWWSNASIEVSPFFCWSGRTIELMNYTFCRGSYGPAPLHNPLTIWACVGVRSKFTSSTCALLSRSARSLVSTPLSSTQRELQSTSLQALQRFVPTPCMAYASVLFGLFSLWDSSHPRFIWCALFPFSAFARF